MDVIYDKYSIVDVRLTVQLLTIYLAAAKKQSRRAQVILKVEENTYRNQIITISLIKFSPRVRILITWKWYRSLEEVQQTLRGSTIEICMHFLYAKECFISQNFFYFIYLEKSKASLYSTMNKWNCPICQTHSASDFLPSLHQQC